uniref:Uncharacterized protein n=1 Tax=Anopheles albimanus TaxID=7167 RepID=A0A182FZK6_ANOAL
MYVLVNKIINLFASLTNSMKKNNHNSAVFRKMVKYQKSVRIPE